MEAIKHIRHKIPSAAILLALSFAIGMPLHANVSISPVSVNFSNQSVGTTSAAANMTLTNAKQRKTTIVSISSSVPQFSYSWPSLPFTLGPGQHLTGTVAFTPAAQQRYNGTLTFTAANGLNIVVSLSGTGVQTLPLATIQPTSETVTAGQTATFSASALGATPLGYQWKKNGTAINGATSAAYATPPATSSDNGAQFSVTVSASTGSASSSPATLTVIVAVVAPLITNQPAGQTVTAGQPASFSVASSGTAPLSYQWKKNGTPIAGATSPTYTTPATATSDNGAQFTVVVSNSVGNITSNAATLTVNTAEVAPSITNQPTGQTVTVGQAASFSAVASGTAPISYQWKKSGTPIAGATSSTYTTPATTTADNGIQFTITVSNSAGNVTSSAATLTVNVIPGQLTANVSTMNFGSVNVGTSSSQSVPLTNSGNANITISNVIYSGGAGFNLRGVSAGLILGPGQSATLNVTFAPGATGNVIGSVTITSNAANSPGVIGLSGTGVGNSSQNTIAVPNAFFGTSLFSSSFPLGGGMVIGTLGKTGGITGHWLEPSCDGGTDPNNSCYTLSGLTSYVNLAQANGLTIVYDFSIPGWMCGAGTNTDCLQLPTNLTWLSNFATAIATKYKGQIKYYETGNEVNVDTESWTDTCTNLVLVNNTIYAAIKAVDPTAIVGAPNMAAFNGTITGGGACVSSPVVAGNSASIWLNNFLQTQDRNGNRPTVDTVGVHTYASQVSTSLDGCDWSNNKLHCAAAPLIHLYNSFRTVMTNAGMTFVPLLVTEGGFGVDNNPSVGSYGCSTNVNDLTSCLTNAQQVAYVGRWLVLSASTWADGAGQLPNWYGYDIDWGSLNGSNGTNPQNASAYGQMETWIKGAIFSQQCRTGSPSTVFVCDFVSEAGKQSEIIFNDNNGATVQYTPPAWAGSYQPLLGSSIPISAGTVTVGDTPILLQ